METTREPKNFWHDVRSLALFAVLVTLGILMWVNPEIIFLQEFFRQNKEIFIFVVACIPVYALCIASIAFLFKGERRKFWTAHVITCVVMFVYYFFFVGSALGAGH